MKLYLLLFLLIIACKNPGSREVQENTKETSVQEDSTPEAVGIPDLIEVEEPRSGAAVSSPLTIKGRARGSWFFEGVAPVELVTEEGQVILEANIEAQESWMTEEVVPFEGKIDFELTKNKKAKKEKRGYLLINRANASGKKEHAQSLCIPVVFEN